MQKILLLLACLYGSSILAQDYYFKNFHPFDTEIPSPEQFLGYGIGDKHTRHDLIVAYLEKLAQLSDRAQIHEYGKTHEGRKLVILTISSPGNLNRLEELKKRHLAFTDPESPELSSDEVPVFINLAYNVHGNEPSSSEAALLTAYTFVASDKPEIMGYLEDVVLFIDPAINPDGRDRHTQWANSYQGSPLVKDPQDAEHNEYWPGGRTNHYWFDLNRDWLLAIHPESRGKLDWYHDWYPNVVTDFHEMGSQNTYFFEPMKINGSLDPIMPEENYGYLNELFGGYYAKALDSIGSLYFTREVFDGTYPGYGSSYPDLQGGLGLLFEQASSRGHAQKTSFGEITFPFTIRNQYVSSLTTVKVAVENKDYLHKYQHDFFKSALDKAGKSKAKGYVFGDKYDKNRVKAFIDKLLMHRIKVYKYGADEFVVPSRQPQYRMVQTMFETYGQYRDSVFYDASAWSLANFYNMKYRPLSSLREGEAVRTTDDLISLTPLPASDYAYVADWDDYNAPAMLHALQKDGIVVSSAFKPFTATTTVGERDFHYGALVIPVSLQDESPAEVHTAIQKAREIWKVPVYAVPTGWNLKGVDLGSNYIKPLKKPKAAMVIGHGVRAYEAGEIWHLLDTRVDMPISKIPVRNFGSVSLDAYNVLVVVSGSYDFTEKQQEKITTWVKQGNTLITIGTGSEWAIKKKVVNEQFIKPEKDTLQAVIRKPYVDASENLGKTSVGGIIVKAELDRTHPLAFGYQDAAIPVYKNNEVWLSPSKNPYATVAKYSEAPQIDGFITTDNLENYLKPAASLLVSPLGSGRVVLFADNPNFRGSWYGTNRLFLNALFLGQHIEVPEKE
jgi:hypothetical protein